MNEEKFSDVINSDVPVVVCFYTPWCGACHRMDPIIGKLAEEYKGQFKFAVVDASKYPQAAAEYYVRAVPTYIIFIDGKPQESRVGVTYEPVFREWLDKWAPAIQVDSTKED